MNNADKTKKSKQHFVYRWDNRVTKEYYIGKHSGHEHDGYISSGRMILERYAVDKDNFVRTILGYYDTSDQALDQERIILGDLYKTDPYCLNLCPGGLGRRSDSVKAYREKLITQTYRKDQLQELFTHAMISEYVVFGFTLNGKTVIGGRVPPSMKEFCQALKGFDLPQDYTPAEHLEITIKNNNWSIVEIGYHPYTVELSNRLKQLQTQIWAQVVKQDTTTRFKLGRKELVHDN